MLGHACVAMRSRADIATCAIKGGGRHESMYRCDVDVVMEVVTVLSNF